MQGAVRSSSWPTYCLCNVDFSVGVSSQGEMDNQHLGSFVGVKRFDFTIHSAAPSSVLGAVETRLQWLAWTQVARSATFTAV